MSYHIYTTRALVLSARAYGEADRIYTILTRDLGLLRARAGGVRKEKSKLRGSLEPVVLSKVSLVRGKEFWRIIAAETLKRIPPYSIIARPLTLLEQLVQGEAHHPELFDSIELMLSRGKLYDESFETEFVAHMLFHLGYLKESDLTLGKEKLIRAINSGLKSSQLAS